LVRLPPDFAFGCLLGQLGLLLSAVDWARAAKESFGVCPPFCLDVVDAILEASGLVILVIFTFLSVSIETSPLGRFKH
jgi:hypothetical protein